MVAFSPGVLQGCFDLLEMTERAQLPFAQILSSFGRFGGAPAGTVIETAQIIGWLIANEEGHARPTSAGLRLLGVVGYEARLRQAILDYIDSTNPSWVQNALFGRARVLAFINRTIGQVFIEAELADSIEPDVIEFWDNLAARARGHKSHRMTEIGREGERLTLTYEMNRTGRSPRWVSIENNADGYDVLSVLGIDDKTPLSIEVKTTRAGPRGVFHLTANEWERTILFENHKFHMWDISKSLPCLAVLNKSDVEPHVPKNRGDGSWELVEIPFEPFSKRFLPQTSRSISACKY